MIELSPKDKGEIVLASGDAHPELAGRIATHMGIELAPMDLRWHPNTEPYTRYEDSVRGKHVFVFQPHTRWERNKPASSAFHQHLEMISTAKGSSAKQITAVSPVLTGSRMDHKSRGREAVSIGVTLRALAAVGTKRVVTMDLHAEQSLYIFDGPSDHLSARPVLLAALREEMSEDDDPPVVFSPDAGGTKRAAPFARALGGSLNVISKEHDPDDPSVIIHHSDRVAGIEGRNAVIVEDMIDTAGTIASAIKVLKNSGANKIYVVATHAWFSTPAVQRLKSAAVDRIIVTDTLPLENRTKDALGDKLRRVSVYEIFADAITQIFTDGSVTSIFED